MMMMMISVEYRALRRTVMSVNTGRPLTCAETEQSYRPTVGTKTPLHNVLCIEATK